MASSAARESTPTPGTTTHKRMSSKAETSNKPSATKHYETDDDHKEVLDIYVSKSDARNWVRREFEEWDGSLDDFTDIEFFFDGRDNSWLSPFDPNEQQESINVYEANDD
ncbi:hypothetical protein BGZ60DRAFT_522787 [Tricladium varicosporioides]|nr:hypothetical protein BGZ60DRAFT_522787 [Hymenoscyphus varicosporioides]